MAIKYIKHLQYLLSYPPHQKIPSHIVEFDPSQSAWVKAGSGLHPHLSTHSPTFDGAAPHLIDAMMDLDGESNDNVWINATSPSVSTSRSATLASPDSPEYEGGSYWNQSSPFILVLAHFIVIVNVN